MELKNRIQWISYNGVKILDIDNSNIRDKEEMLFIFIDTQELIFKSKTKVNCLINLSNTLMSLDFHETAKQKAQREEIEQNVAKRAYFGVTEGINTRLLQDFINSFPSGTSKIFKTREEALLWLASEE